MTEFGDYQNEIYFKGLRGVKPKLPVNFKLLQQKAGAALPEGVLSYIAGGCGDEHTQELNVSAFEKWGLVPRMLVDCSKRDLSIDLFGLHLPSPLFISPIGVLGICAQDGHGDLAAARAAAITGVPIVASTLSNDPLEAVAKEIGGGVGIFQLYTPTDRELAENLVHRAEAAGFKALVVTLDTSTLGWRAPRLERRELPAIARPRPRQLLQRSALPRAAGETAGGGPSGGRPASVTNFRKAADLGRPALAAISHKIASDPQRHLPS